MVFFCMFQHGLSCRVALAAERAFKRATLVVHYVHMSYVVSTHCECLVAKPANKVLATLCPSLGSHGVGRSSISPAIGVNFFPTAYHRHKLLARPKPNTQARNWKDRSKTSLKSLCRLVFFDKLVQKFSVGWWVSFPQFCGSIIISAKIVFNQLKERTQEQFGQVHSTKPQNQSIYSSCLKTPPAAGC